jgi:hypothetical protein
MRPFAWNSQRFAPTVLPDEELLRRVAGGDPAAYTTLYERYQARLFRFLVSFVNDHRKTEDLTQEVLLEVWKKAGRCGGDVGLLWNLGKRGEGEGRAAPTLRKRSKR